MSSMPSIYCAKAFAIAAHEAIGQRRKHTGEPYWHHCQEVVQILLTHTTRHSFDGFGSAIAAAWLHDVVEDTQLPLTTIYREFGEAVGDIVSDLTDTPTIAGGPNRAARKALDRERLGKASALTKTVKLADLISNTRSITEHDPKFAVAYLREKQLLLPFLVEGDPALYDMACAQIHPLLGVLGE